MALRTVVRNLNVSELHLCMCFTIHTLVIEAMLYSLRGGYQGKVPTSSFWPWLTWSLQSSLCFTFSLHTSLHLIFLPQLWISFRLKSPNLIFMYLLQNFNTNLFFIYTHLGKLYWTIQPIQNEHLLFLNYTATIFKCFCQHLSYFTLSLCRLTSLTRIIIFCSTLHGSQSPFHTPHVSWKFLHIILLASPSNLSV